MYQLAQLNIGKALGAMDSDVMTEFTEGLDPINQIAEMSDGFVWRLKDETGNATNLHYFNDPNMLVNMSVWQDVDSLKHFMFQTHHLHFLKQRKQWFETESQATYVLWWIPTGHIPDMPEAMARLTLLRQEGESAEAFSFSKVFAPPSERL